MHNVRPYVYSRPWVAHGRKSFLESFNVKCVPNVIAELKCKVQNNKKIQETQTSVTSTMKAEQER